jgi:thiol-disulfide isomerase/thioredoxin
MNVTKNLKNTDCKIRGSDVYINSSIMNGNPGFLLIYATWCNHCVRFKPVYEQLNAKLNNTSINNKQFGGSQQLVNFPCLAIESLELDANPTLSKALKFQGFPTLKAIGKDGKVLGDYKGDRDIVSLLNNVCTFYHHCITKAS